VGEHLGHHAGAGLVLLGELVIFAVAAAGAAQVVEGLGRADVDLAGAELGIVEEERGLGGGLLLEGDGG
jgi:hypothetical protein